ncbi:MAG: C-terminal binding protein [Acidimicrobiia bacterium]|nr:C-terminal binding protein [Acidimicrobiia bacterium]
MNQRVAILGTRYPDFTVEEEILSPLGAEIVAGSGDSDEEIVATAGDAMVILAGSRPRFTSSVLGRLSCRAIVRYGVGIDSVDLAAARRCGIAVARVPDYGTEAVAVHAVALALASLRRIPAADRSLWSGAWGFDDLRPLHLPSALTAGVVGYGRIGRAVGSMLRAIGFDVLAHDPLIAADEIGLVSLDELLARSDLVTLHAPGARDGSPLIDGDAIGRFRPGSVLVNTARGSLVDLDALIAGIREDRPAVAALDVFPEEPPDLDRLRSVSDRIILTPHMAWYTEESELDLRRKAAGEAARALRGETLLNPVDDGGDGTT